MDQAPSCPPGFHWDESVQACVRDAGAQRSGIPSMPPGATNAIPSSTASAPADASAATPAEGGFLSNPAVAAGAILGGTALATQHMNVSSIPHWLQGQFGSDIVDSPNMQNFGKKVVGERGTEILTAAARPFWDSISPREWKKFPEDIKKSITALWGG